MTNGTSVTPSANAVSGSPAAGETPSRPVPPPDCSFPKSHRLLRPRLFREVYNKGSRFTCPLFAAFCLSRATSGEMPGPRIGFTTPRALGKAVDRNRIRRRLRETVRHVLGQLEPQWDIVFNPRRPVLTATPETLQREVERLFRRCNGR